MSSARHPSLIPNLLMIVLILSFLDPQPALADDATPTPEPAPEVILTPEISTTPVDLLLPTKEGTSSPEGGEFTPGHGMDVVVTQENQPGLQDQQASLNKLISSLPIWCPPGVEPIPGENGCTAEFGSLSILMSYLEENGISGEGTIWVSDAFQNSGGLENAGQSADNQPVSEGPQGTVQEAPSVNIIVLDSLGRPLSPGDENTPDTILNGQPIWCPDGTTPYNNPDGCTTSNGSMGMLVSLMENGSLEDGAIYIQTDGSNRDGQNPPIPDPLVVDDEVAADSSLAGSNAVQGEHREIVDPQSRNEIDAAATQAGLTGEAVQKEAAAEGVLRDPIWCPDGAAPTPGAGGCSASYASLQTLVAFLNANQPAADGTIWVEQGIDSSGASIMIDGNSSTTWRDYSLTVQGGWGGVSGNPAITGSTTFNQMISVSNWLDDVALKDLRVDNSAQTGIFVSTTGNIALEDVSSAGNAIDGAFLNNNLAGSSGSVTMTGNNSFDNNVDDGLVIRSNGAISAQNLSAQGNGDVGAYLKNDTGSGSVALTGAGIFDNNLGSSPAATFENGLKIDSNGSVSLNNISANGNAASGAVLATSGGTVTFTGANSFVGNGASGLQVSILNGGQIDLQNITANGNTANGAILALGAGPGTGQVTISGAANAFNLNGSDGLVISTYGDIVISNLTADGNTGTASGSKFGTACNITINSSTFSNNSAYGFDDSLSAPAYPAAILLNSATFSGNISGDYLVNDPNTVIPAAATYPCTVFGSSSLNRTITQPAVFPLNYVKLANNSGAQPVELDCTNFRGTTLVLPNGDQVTYLCPTTGEASLAGLKESAENFPGTLPQEFVFASAVETQLLENGTALNLTAGEVVVTFVIPVDLLGFNFAILHYDGLNWQDLATVVFTDGKKVFLAGVKTADGGYEASTNFTGLFVLARK